MLHGDCIERFDGTPLGDAHELKKRTSLWEKVNLQGEDNILVYAFKQVITAWPDEELEPDTLEKMRGYVFGDGANLWFSRIRKWFLFRSRELSGPPREEVRSLIREVGGARGYCPTDAYLIRRRRRSPAKPPLKPLVKFKAQARVIPRPKGPRQNPKSAFAKLMPVPTLIDDEHKSNAF